MTWNWRLAEWPHFRWEKREIQELEARFLHDSGILVGAVFHLSEDEKESLKIAILGNEALETSAIEGEILERESLQSSIREQFGLQSDRRRVRPAEEGMAQMVTDLYQTWQKPLTKKTLTAWHKMIMRGRHDLMDVGRYRTHEDAMEIVTGAIDKPKVHYVAPPSERIETEMNSFLKWFNDSGPKAARSLNSLERTGIAHLRFVSIHPFEDGNGRIGRAIAEKALAQGMGRPTLAALSTTIAKNRKQFYQQLKGTNHSLEITEYLVWFGNTVLASITHTRSWVEFYIQKTKLLDRLRGKINPRQEKILLRMFQEGPLGFTGGVSAENSMKLTGASRATATRDLSGLVRMGALVREGDYRYTRYHLSFEIDSSSQTRIG